MPHEAIGNSDSEVGLVIVIDSIDELNLFALGLVFRGYGTLVEGAAVLVDSGLPGWEVSPEADDLA